MSWNEVVELVVKAQTGDRAAYGELIERFQPSVYAVALSRLRNPTDAQELTQEVFIHVMTKIGQLRDPQCFAGWLRQITVRMAINRMTRNTPHQGTDQEILQNTASEGETPLSEMIRNEQRSQLWKSLDRLKKTDRETLVAFYIKGRSLKEMSEDFETPVGTIKRRLHVARNRLREVLEGDMESAEGASPPTDPLTEGADDAEAVVAGEPVRRSKRANRNEERELVQSV
ncbi:MAG: RNA polymerase sigma factor [Gemmataceae bacterium]